MSKPLKLIAANDTFGALTALAGALAGEQAVFITPAEVNGFAPKPNDLPETVPEAVALIVESSGSTGTPKRISLSTRALLASARSSEERLGGPGQWLLALPTNFIAGSQVLVRSLVADTQPVILNTQLPFTTEAFVRGASLLDGERRYTSLVPAQLARLAAAVDEDSFLFSMLRRFNAILVGGQRADMAVVHRLRSMGINIIVSYGMTETAGGCVYDGEPLTGVSIKLVDGLVAVSGPTLAEGVGPWFQTNDLGELVEGKLEVLGRADRVFVSGGIKVSLERVEEVVSSIAGVQAAAAVALADGDWGERAAIAYEGSPEAELSAALENQISPAARPVRVLRVAQLPKTATGKPDLIAIRQLFAD
jgi:o-succinylbenzoate---CoA ligase